MLNNESRPTAKGNQKVKLFRRPFHAMGTTRNITDVSIHNAIDSLIPPPPKKRLRCPYARHDTNFHSLLIRRNSVVNRKWKRCYGFTADPFRDRSTPSLETNASLSSQRGSRRRREATLGNVFPGPDWTAGRRALDTRTAAACRWRKRENELKSHGRPRENPPIRADEGAAPLLMSH